MKWHCPHFRTGVALTFFIALLAIHFEEIIPHYFQPGVLTLALLLGIALKQILHIPDEQRTGINFSAKNLLRIGIVLIGVRLDFHSFFHSWLTLFLLASSIVIGGLFFITWLGRQWHLSPMLSLLIAIDSSICGGSAVAAIGETIGAQEEEIALIIPLCSLIGMSGIFILKTIQYLFHLTPEIFGLLAGSTLHEVAQVTAAVLLVPGASSVGMASKMMRVLLLAPTTLILTIFLSYRQQKENGSSIKINISKLFDSIWFVFGILFVGIINNLGIYYFHSPIITVIDHSLLLIATFLMTMAMAAFGLQFHFSYLIKNSHRAIGVAILGWLFLVTLTTIEIYLIKL